MTTTEPLADVIRELRQHSCLFHADSEMKVSKAKLALVIDAAEKAERYEKALRGAKRRLDRMAVTESLEDEIRLETAKDFINQALAPEQPAQEPCQTCGGSALILNMVGEPDDCPNCNGTGRK